MQLSVVIITRNEAHIIGNTLQSASAVTNNIIVVDSGSTDGTQAIAKKFAAHIIETTWDGYGANKNKGNAAAANDWILSLDADEVISEELRSSLQQLQLQDKKTVYSFRRRSYFCNKMIRYGEWGKDNTIRIFNRKHTHWNNAAVHESLELSADTNTIMLPGDLLHYTVSSIADYLEKTDRYAKLSAEKYFAQGKRTNFFKIYVAPVLSFIYYYLFRLGFLDGKEGYLIAKTTARYSHLKYYYLKKMNAHKKQRL